MRCSSEESVRFAVKELQNVVSWYSKHTKGDDDSLRAIEQQLDKYVKEEVKLKSVVETIKKLHKMTVSSKAGAKDFTCYLCKSGIN